MQPGSWFHRTECFGPVLGVMRADDLDHAIELQNGTDFGLTGGLQSLDPAEIGHWLERVEVGNAYVNRHMTGAIVRRQPFGGWKRSSVGRGAKAGGPDDILRFLRPVVAGPPVDATASYGRWWREQFGTERDDAGLACEANVLRYRAVRGVIVRTTAATTTGELSLLRRAAALTGVPMSVSAPPETDAELAARVADAGAERLRTLGPIDDELAAACPPGRCGGRRHAGHGTRSHRAARAGSVSSRCHRRCIATAASSPAEFELLRRAGPRERASIPGGD